MELDEIVPVDLSGSGLLTFCRFLPVATLSAAHHHGTIYRINSSGSATTVGHRPIPS